MDKEDRNNLASLSIYGMTTYLKDFQAFANLPVTGKLDQDTVEMMEMPRCGVRDVRGYRRRRQKRYAVHGKRALTKIYFQQLIQEKLPPFKWLLSQNSFTSNISLPHHTTLYYVKYQTI